MFKKTHIALNVTSIEESVDFYRALFGVEPAKHREAYAKFDLNEPALNLSLNKSDSVRGNRTSHFGIQVDLRDSVLSEKSRLEKLGLPTLLEENNNCCYAVQDKVWVKDPDGNAWEVFVVLKDKESGKSDVSTCCG